MPLMKGFAIASALYAAACMKGNRGRPVRSNCFDWLTVNQCARRFEAQSMLGPIPFYRLFNALLITLLIMHIYWFGLIVRIAWRVITKGSPDDVRESDSDED